jgi:hypothetical protein
VYTYILYTYILVREWKRKNNFPISRNRPRRSTTQVTTSYWSPCQFPKDTFWPFFGRPWLMVVQVCQVCSRFSIDKGSSKQTTTLFWAKKTLQLLITWEWTNKFMDIQPYYIYIYIGTYIVHIGSISTDHEWSSLKDRGTPSYPHHFLPSKRSRVFPSFWVFLG